MPMNPDLVAEYGTPEWWLRYLLRKPELRPTFDRLPLDEDIRHRQCARERMALLWDYRHGRPRLPYLSAKHSEAFGRILRKARVNLSPMVVNAMLDRMQVLGVSTAADNDTDGDDLAREIADKSNFATMCTDLIDYVLTYGHAYATVLPPKNRGDKPLLVAEDPRWCVGDKDPENPGRLRAAMRRFYDDARRVETAMLFLDGKVYRAERSGARMTSVFSGGEWDWSGEPEELAWLTPDLGDVPMVMFENLGGVGEFENHLDLVDRIADTVLQRLVLAWYQSFRQRAVVGNLDGTDDDDYEDDEPSDPVDWAEVFQADPGALWQVPEGIEFWESSQADLTPILSAVKDDFREFAAVTSTPLHLITPDAANGSAEGAALMRESLVFKVKDRRKRFTPGLQHLWELAFACVGEPERADGTQILWGSIESYSLADRADASTKLKGTLSQRKIATNILEMSPTEAAENEQQLVSDRLLAGTASVGTAAPGGQAGQFAAGMRGTPAPPTPPTDDDEDEVVTP